MKSFSQMPLARRLMAVFAAVIAIFVAAAAVSLYSLHRLSEADRWNTHSHKVIGLALELTTDMINMETGARGFLLAGQDAFLGPWRQGQAQFDAHWDELKALTADNPAQQARLDEMKRQRAAFEAAVTPLIESRRGVDGGSSAMDIVIAQFSLGADKAAMDAFRAADKAFVGAEEALLAERSQAAETTRATMTLVLVLGALAAAGLAAGLGWALSRSVLGQLGGEPTQALAVAREIAAGRLDAHVPVAAGDQHSLMAAMKTMTESLRQTVHIIRQGVDSVSTASTQIASGNHDLSARTEQQSSSLQETAASMEQLTSTVRQSAVSVRRTHLELKLRGDNDPVQLTNSWTRWIRRTVASAGATAQS